MNKDMLFIIKGLLGFGDAAMTRSQIIQRFSPLYIIMMASMGLYAGSVSAFPVDDAFPLPHPEPNAFSEHPRAGVPDSQYPSLNPGVTDAINEPHPFPDYLGKFIRGKRIPLYYRELLRVPPVNQVQSQVFDPQAFKKMQRIGVVGFENKIQGIDRDEFAGELIAGQFFNGLQKVQGYVVTDPARMLVDFRMRMETTPSVPGSDSPPASTDQSGIRETVYDLPYPGEKFDGVMIGAVTRFTNKYKDRHGKLQESVSARVEFGAYLISTQTGQAVWGVRFVGSQKPSWANLLDGKYYWMDKKELSQFAVKKILKDFNPSPNP